MLTYLKQIQQLTVLQKVDDEILTLEAELEAAPRELAQAEERVGALRDRQGQIQEKIELLGAQQTRLEQEIDDDTMKVRKSKNKLMMVGNTREYHAMMREMDSLEKLNRMREEEKVALAEELAVQRQALDALGQDIATQESEVTKMRSGLDARLEEGGKQLEKLTKQRQGAGKAVPRPILGRYELIRSRLANPVIVSVTAGVCSGCNITIPPQIYNDLQKGQQIISCPNCQRLMYWTEHVKDEEQGEE
jgi:predicted  nucleic acid-binding Zn-ribbon protein